MSSTVMTITMPDILYEPYRLDTTTVMAQLADFGLKYEQLYTLLRAAPTCMLAGGAAANIFHNYLNPDNQKPMGTHADLDFWIHDPHIEHENPSRYLAFTNFKNTVEGAGYVQHHRHPAIAVWYQKAFQVQGNTRIRCNWWTHPVSGKRIQLIFTSTPPEQTLLNFDLPVCRAAITTHSGEFHLQWTGQAEKVMRDRLMMVPSTETQTPLLAYRIAKYAERYDISLLHS